MCSYIGSLPDESFCVCVFVNAHALSVSLTRVCVCVFMNSLSLSLARSLASLSLARPPTHTLSRALSVGSLAREGVCDADSTFLGAQRERESDGKRGENERLKVSFGTYTSN